MTILLLYGWLLMNPPTHDPLAALLEAPAVTQFVAPDRAGYGRAVALFRQTLDDPSAPATAKAWQPLGFALQEIVAGEIWLLRDTQKRGAGFYLFRKSGAFCLQIPHRFFDRGTGEIGMDLFREGDFRAAAWNTASRKIHATGTKTKADLARFPGSFFQAFHEAWLNRGRGAAIQIHGYARNKRKSAAGKKAHIILSSGAKFPLAFVRDGAKALTEAGFPGVNVYGDQVFELGGTTNIQAQAALQRAQPFVHIELSGETRKRLAADPNRRTAFLKALLRD